ncbi:MAG TPA: response regulator [Steroidobacteraceae bacterium]|nr:response regulator [Steroidobacteraceae bacterium]
MSAMRPTKIVLVEDSLDLCQTWKELLSLDGHEVKIYLDGRSLLQDPAAIHWCDVVITDYYLPDVNGVELVARIRGLRPQLPVILLSGMRDGSVIELVRKMPHAAYLPKPADVDELEATLDRLVVTGTRVHGEAGTHPA